MTLFLLIMGALGQWLGLIAVVFGAIVEYCYKANVGFLAVTIGSVLYAVGTKCMELYYKDRLRGRGGHDDSSRL